MLYTLGGSGGLKSFRPDMLGRDGTRATLRGFRNFRFRDRDMLLMQAEYRIPVHQVRAHDGLRRRRPGRPANIGSVHESPHEHGIQPQLRAQGTERSGAWTWDLAAAKGCDFFWSFGGFQTALQRRDLRGGGGRLLLLVLLFVLLGLSFRLSVFAQSSSNISRNCLAAARSLTMMPTSRRLSSSSARRLMLPRNISWPSRSIARRCRRMPGIFSDVSPSPLLADLADDAHIDAGLDAILQQLDHLRDR